MFFKKRTPANTAANTTTSTVELTTTTPSVSKHQPKISSAEHLLAVSEAYSAMVRKLFLTLIHRVLSESTPVDSEEFNKIRNNNSYAVAEGKGTKPGKYIDYGIHRHKCVWLDYEFWVDFINSDWTENRYFYDFSVGLNHPTHLSGDTGIVDGNIGGLRISNRCGWDEAFLHRLVAVANLLMVTKFAEAGFEGVIVENYHFPFMGFEYNQYDVLSNQATTDDETSAHNLVMHSSPSKYILVRRKATEAWMRPRACNVYASCRKTAEAYKHQYFLLRVSNENAYLTAFHAS